MNQETVLIAERAELLATVFLTRRLNVNVHHFGDKADEGIDFICTIRHDRVKGFLPFGVVVWGTAKALRTEDDATAFGRQKKRTIKQARFFVPVVVLLFSMEDDEGYFSWLVEPCQEGIELLHLPELRFAPCSAKQLDMMVKRIEGWYERLSVSILADAGAIDPAQCTDGE